MKRGVLKIGAALLLLSFVPGGGELRAQNHVRKAMQNAERLRKEQEARQRQTLGQQESLFLNYIVEDGDTIYVDNLLPATKYAAKVKTKKEWRKYYRLVYNFPRVYVYAQAAARLSAVADSTIEARHMNKRQRQKYIDGLQDQIIKDFEGVLRKMSYSQGALLIRLIDREVQRTSYAIIKDYKGGLSAGFWQGIAKLFDGDLKTQYDPEGVDRETEELVEMWNAGTFDAMYYSVFGESPPHPAVPEMYR